MAANTTPIQALRAFAAWLLAVGLIALFFTGGQLLVWDDPLWAIIAVATTAAGGVLILRTQRRLRALDAANRPFLFGEGGGEIMHARADLDKAILTVSRWLLALFIVLGVAFFFMLSAASCGERIDGYCGQVGSPSDAVMTWAQFVAVAVGAALLFAPGKRPRRKN